MKNVDALRTVVMPGFDPGIHSGARAITATVTAWIAGSSPAMWTGLGG
jgi:hypothetical protein